MIGDVAGHVVGEWQCCGKYDEVIHGYGEVSLLESVEWTLLTLLWRAGLIDMASWYLRTNTWDDGWMIKKLLERSPLMGADAAAFR